MGQGLVTAELEQGAFLHARLSGLVHLAAEAGPVQGQGLHHFRHGIVDVGGRAEVVGLAAGLEGPLARAQQMGAQPQIAGQGLQHQLPGAGGPGAADLHGLTGGPGAGAVGHDAVGGPVTAADDVAGSHGGAGRAVLEKALEIGMGDDLGAALGSGVGVVAAQMVGLAVAPDPLVVAVALVRGDEDRGFHAGALAHGLQHVEGAQHVGFEGQGRVFVRFAHQGLGGQMEDHIGAEFLHGADHGITVADVAAHVLHVLFQMHGLEMGRAGGHAVGKAADGGAHLAQPRGQPGALETGMAGDEHTAAFITVGKHGLLLPVVFAPAS